MIRARAADPEELVKHEDGTPAANFVVGLYTQPFETQSLPWKETVFLIWSVGALLNLYWMNILKKKSNYESVSVVPGLRRSTVTILIPEQAIAYCSKDGRPTLQQNPGYLTI